MKKTVFILILFTILFSGCIEIVEEITINNDQTGKIEYRIETNQIISLLNNFTDMMDIALENQIKSEAKSLAERIGREKGIKNVKVNTKGDLTNYSFEVDFASADDLNTAIYHLFGYKQNMLSPKYLKMGKHHFKRKNFAPYVKKYFEEEGIELPEEDLLSVVNFKTVVNFPRDIKNFRGDGLQLMNNKKTLIQKHPFSGILENETNVSIKTRY
jgi:hypothetical protein